MHWIGTLCVPSFKFRTMQNYHFLSDDYDDDDDDNDDKDDNEDDDDDDGMLFEFVLYSKKYMNLYRQSQKHSMDMKSISQSTQN